MQKILVLPSFYPMKLDYPRGSFFQEQAKLLKKNGADISVVFNENRSITSFRINKIKTAHFQTEYNLEEGIPVLRRKSWNVIPTQFVLGQKIWVLMSVKLIEHYIKYYGRPDLIHVHCVFNAGLVAKKIKNKYGIPYVITEHSSLFSSENLPDGFIQTARSVYDDASKIIVVSTSFRKVIADKIGITADRIQVIPNFIDSDFLKPSEKALKGGESKIIFTVCFHEANKKIDRLLEAFSLIHKSFPDWTLVIGGEGSETKKLKLKARELGVESLVTFTGFLSKSEVKDYLDNTSIFVSSSDFESFGVILIEAMSMGVPIVATESGGPQDIVTPEIGVLVKRTVQDLAKGIEYVIKNYDQYNKVFIRQHAIANYSGNAIVEKYDKIYKTILSEKK
jgi:glycosyltransferase involved in cell wall biosynthesis